MEFVLIGPGQLGQLLLRQAGRDCLVIGQDADSTRQISELYGCLSGRKRLPRRTECGMIRKMQRKLHRVLNTA